jgi:hypothetical protein
MRRPAVWMGSIALLLSGLAAGQSYPSNYPPSNYPPQSNYPYNNGAAIPEGTRFVVRLKDKLDTNKMTPGKKFKAELLEDLRAPNGDVIPRGKKLKGHVSSVDKGFHSRMILSFDEIETNHGSMPIAATVTAVPGEHGVNQQTGAEGEISRNTDKKRTVETAAGGAAVGALGGAIAGGTKGAIIGAGVGAGVGAGASLLTGRNLVLDKNQQLELKLDRPLTVPTH